MRIVIASLLLALTAGLAHAADATCTAQAAEKKLAGAAKNSFIKKCEKDNKPKCEGTASSRSARRTQRLRLPLPSDRFQALGLTWGRLSAFPPRAPAARRPAG
jgi:hypothetical protein